MNLNNEPFRLIDNETKTIELRLNDDKRRLLKVKDYIEFNNRMTNEKLLVEIEDLIVCGNFEELYQLSDKISMGYKDTEIANPKDMEEYYSIDDQKKYGVLGIKIKK